MNNQELINTLKTASYQENNIALKMLLLMAADRIESLREFLPESDKDKTQ
jgi:hypothetical protein